MYSALGDAALPAPGFPIRRSTGQRLFSASPWLIAAVHVLLRLLVPRHPPCALTILTVSCSRFMKRVAPNDAPSRKPRARLLTLCASPDVRGETRKSTPDLSRECFGLMQFSRSTEATRGLIPPASLKTEQRQPAPEGTGSEPGRRVLGLPRKEVIQPQLPLRLPCYDFTPITSPTFDGSLPKG
jgi:hypothetical protein